jgi:hypothetical protein
MGVLCKLMTVQENVGIMAKFCPDSYLSGLVSLLCTSVTTAEVLSTTPVGDFWAGSEPSHSGRWEKIPPSVGDFNDFSDCEIRDMTLEALRVMCSFPDSTTLSTTVALQTALSESGGDVSMKERIASLPSCLRILSNIVTKVNKGMKTEGYSRALALLGLLAENPRNVTKLMAIECSMCVRALSDESISGILLLQSASDNYQCL